MNTYLQQKLIDIRIAEMRSEAERHRIARTARPACRATRRPAGHGIAGAGSVLRHVLTALLTTCGQRRQSGTVAAQTGIRQISLVCAPEPGRDKATEF